MLEEVALLGEADRGRSKWRWALRRERPSDEFAAAGAKLRLLAALGERERLLVVLDGVNWFDRASSAGLAYVARRVAATEVAQLATMRCRRECIRAAASEGR